MMPEARTASYVSMVSSSRLKPPAIIAEFEKVAVGVEDRQNQGQRLAKIGAAGTTRLLACIEHGGCEDLANYRDLVIRWRCTILEPWLPSDKLSLVKRM
jgi:hypothetical protein